MRVFHLCCLEYTSDFPNTNRVESLSCKAHAVSGLENGHMHDCCGLFCVLITPNTYVGVAKQFE